MEKLYLEFIIVICKEVEQIRFRPKPTRVKKRPECGLKQNTLFITFILLQLTYKLI